MFHTGIWEYEILIHSNTAKMQRTVGFDANPMGYYVCVQYRVMSVKRGFQQHVEIHEKRREIAPEETGGNRALRSDAHE